MQISLTYEELLCKYKNLDYVMIDVRSESEFSEYTIPGSINIPILSDKEREAVGYTYTKVSKKEAKILGIEYVSKKLPTLFKEILALQDKHTNLIFFCARGGYRSSSITGLMQSIGINASKLIDGYKGYRNYINKNLNLLIEPLELVVLYGNTGTGKTKVLNELKKLGADVLDLEHCANHRGSVFGNVGLNKPNSQKMFESLIFDTLYNRKSNLLFVEGESKTIGKSIIPDALFNKMKNGIQINITSSIENRIDNIYEDYICGDDENIIKSLENLRNRMGNYWVDEKINLVKNKNYKEVIKDLILHYYDPLYQKNKKEYALTLENNNPTDTAKKLYSYFKKR
jgi:tRNA 2-selenouridine synthase